VGSSAGPSPTSSDAVSSDAVSFAWGDHAGVLFDLDGVITPTATIHEQAWAALFAGFDYTEADYIASIDGRPRYDGVRTFLDSRDVELPWGDPDDPPGDDTVCALGNHKNLLFNELLEREGIAPYPGSQATLELLERLAIPAAIVSSSKNAMTVLRAAGLADRFDVIVDGVVAASEHLAGKPAPDAFLLGAARLGVDPGDTVVVEDAVSGVAAGAAGDFAVVIGVDRGAGADALLEHGASFVVDDLDRLLPRAERA
jgi:beta-phosphoglucomutase family hydrolase